MVGRKGLGFRRLVGGRRVHDRRRGGHAVPRQWGTGGGQHRRRHVLGRRRLLRRGGRRGGHLLRGVPAGEVLPRRVRGRRRRGRGRGGPRWLLQQQQRRRRRQQR